MTDTCIYDPKCWDIANVLELLSLELLEARDAELDRRIDEFQELLQTNGTVVTIRTLYRTTIQELAELRVIIALIFDRRNDGRFQMSVF